VLPSHPKFQKRNGDARSGRVSRLKQRSPQEGCESVRPKNLYLRDPLIVATIRPQVPCTYGLLILGVGPGHPSLPRVDTSAASCERDALRDSRALVDPMRRTPTGKQANGHTSAAVTGNEYASIHQRGVHKNRSIRPRTGGGLERPSVARAGVSAPTLGYPSADLPHRGLDKSTRNAPTDETPYRFG
jgi:hypothetical protein